MRYDRNMDKTDYLPAYPETDIDENGENTYYLIR